MAIHRPWLRHEPVAPIDDSRGHASLCSASRAARKMVASHANSGSTPPTFPSSTSCTSCPSASTGATASRPYGTYPGGYSVNETRWVRHLATATGWLGPVLRLRRWCTPIEQTPPSPSVAAMHCVGISGTNPPPSAAAYGETMNVRGACGCWVWQVSTQRDPLTDASKFHVDSGLQRRPRLRRGRRAYLLPSA
jgi:hypothetical protein